MADKQITPFQLTDQFTMDNFNQRINETNIALQSKPNPNLLDNWYFGNPVNQRGQTAYTAVGYTIDRWKLEANGTVKSASVVSNGIALSNGDDTTYLNFVQIVEKIPAGTYVVSFLVDDFSNVNQVFCSANNQSSFTFNSNVVSLKFTLDADSDSVRVGIQKKLSGNALTVKAAKLELGSQQTLAHQDADGNWVLNEIPDYGEQLARCQRYFRRIKAKQVYSSGVMFSFPIVDVGGATWANINVILSTMMRDAKPSVSFHGLSVADYVSTQSRGSISDNAERNVIYYTGDTVKLSINTGITLTDTDAIMMASEGYIDIINDL